MTTTTIRTPGELVSLADDAERGHRDALATLRRLAVQAGYVTRGSHICTNPEDVDSDPAFATRSQVAIANGWRGLAHLITTGKAPRVVARLLGAERYDEGLHEDAARESAAGQAISRIADMPMGTDAVQTYLRAVPVEVSLTTQPYVAHREGIARLHELALLEDVARASVTRAIHREQMRRWLETRGVGQTPTPGTVARGRERDHEDALDEDRARGDRAFAAMVDPTLVPHAFNPLGTRTCRTILGGITCARTAEAHVVIDADYAIEEPMRLYFRAALGRQHRLGFRGRVALAAALDDLRMMAEAEDRVRSRPRAGAVLAPQLHP